MAESNCNDQLVMRDFNYPEIEWSKKYLFDFTSNQTEDKLARTIQENCLYQLVDRSTRWRGSDEANVLELCFVNNANLVKNIDYQSPLGKTDHCILLINLNIIPIREVKKG